MVYEYNRSVVNNNKPENFYNDLSFVGYILPDGSIFKCKDHNITDVATSLRMYLMLLDTNYEDKDEILNAKTDNAILQLVIKYFHIMSHDQIHDLFVLVNEGKVLLSDLLVSFFGCHLVTRLKKEILTSETNHRCFYNYLLNDFKITTIAKLVYDDKEKKFKYIEPVDRNEYLYDEITRIKQEIGKSDIDLFYKSR